MKRWIFAAVAVILLTGVYVALVPAPIAEAEHADCNECDDCIGGCICEQKAAEDACVHDLQAGNITQTEFNACLRQALRAQIDCFSGCDP